MDNYNTIKTGGKTVHKATAKRLCITDYDVYIFNMTFIF